jgi:serine/threonine protein kinase
VILSGRYELLTRLGRGGMGQVWESRDLLLGRKVAIKTIHLESQDDLSPADRFRREAVATAALNHPSIVTVHDTGVEDGTAFLVMELVGGQDLARTLRERGALPLAEVARIGGSVAAALTAAHAIGVVHRDIKPANVLLDGDRVKVVDFGIAMLTRSASTSLTAPGTALGTAEYMSPEQATSGPITPASDVYSLGCLLTALLTGRPPFTGEHPLAVLNRQVQADPDPLRLARPDAPAELEHLVATMLAKDPASRPSAADVRARLASLHAPGPTPHAGAPTEPATTTHTALAETPTQAISLTPTRGAPCRRPCRSLRRARRPHRRRLPPKRPTRHPHDHATDAGCLRSPPSRRRWPWSRSASARAASSRRLRRHPP